MAEDASSVTGFGRFFRVQEVATVLAISKTETYNLIKSGSLVGHRFGTGKCGIRVAEGDLQKYIASRRIAGEESQPHGQPATERLQALRPRRRQKKTVAG